MKRAVLGLLLGVGMTACGGDTGGSSGENEGSDGDGGSTGGDGGGDGTGTGDGGSSSDGDSADGGSSDGGTGASTTGETGSGDTGDPDDNRILPLEVGRTWTYTVIPLNNEDQCPAGEHSSEVLGTADIDGRMAYEMTSYCTGVPSRFLWVSGDRVEQYYDYDGSWTVVLAEPVVEGHEWECGTNITCAWEDAGTVTVAAGTFSECWRRVRLGADATATYCRGVGLVSARTDHSDSGWDVELIAMNFWIASRLREFLPAPTAAPRRVPRLDRQLQAASR